MNSSPTTSGSRTIYTASKSTMWLWGVGTIADALMIQTFGLVFQIFNTGFKMDAATLSWILFVPRFIDGILGPVIGNLSDNTHSRWGRRKPFLVATSFLGAMIIAGIWWMNPAWSTTVQGIYLVIFATLYYTTWGTYSLTHYALGYELTDDYHERARVMAIRNVYLQVIVCAVGWTYWLALRPEFGGEINGIRWVSAGMGILIIITGLVPVFACKERFSAVQLKKDTTPLIQAFKETMRIKPFVIYLLLRFFSMFGITVFNQLIFYVNVYYVCGGDKTLGMKIAGIGTMLTVVVTIAAMPLVPRLSRKIGKRTAVIIGSVIAVLQACIVPFLFSPNSGILKFFVNLFGIQLPISIDWTLPFSIYGIGDKIQGVMDISTMSPYLQLIAALLMAPMIQIAFVLRDAIVPDICDLDELESGKRREALFTSVVNFVYKMEVSVCILLVGQLIQLADFNKEVAAQQAHVLTRFQWFTFLPNVVFAILALILAIKFPITEAFMKKVHEQLEERRQKTP